MSKSTPSVSATAEQKTDSESVPVGARRWGKAETKVLQALDYGGPLTSFQLQGVTGSRGSFMDLILSALVKEDFIRVTSQRGEPLAYSRTRKRHGLPKVDPFSLMAESRKDVYDAVKAGKRSMALKPLIEETGFGAMTVKASVRELTQHGLIEPTNKGRVFPVVLRGKRPSPPLRVEAKHSPVEGSNKSEPDAGLGAIPTHEVMARVKGEPIPPEPPKAEVEEPPQLPDWGEGELEARQEYSIVWQPVKMPIDLQNCWSKATVFAGSENDARAYLQVLCEGQGIVIESVVKQS